MWCRCACPSRRPRGSSDPARCLGSLRRYPGLRLEPERFRAIHQRHFGRLLIARARPSGSRPGLRARYRAARRTLPAPLRTAHERAITRHAITAPEVLRARRIAAFAAADGEPRLDALLERLARARKVLALPVVRAGGRMDFYRFRPGDTGIPNRYGITEPPISARFIDTRSLDLVLVPLVAFDVAGNRLGMGGGYYDRHFGALTPGLRPLLVGVAFEVCRAPDLPAGPRDVKLDAVLTETGWHAGDG